jgi:hypothetical protein
MKKKSKKIKDTGEDISAGSRLHRYWSTEGFKKEYLHLRKPLLPEAKIFGKETDPYVRLLKNFKLRGIEFGNWVNNDARNSYLIAAIVALTDLNSITGFGSKGIGFKKLGLAFGARGMSKAAGHFEPGTWVINLTRYQRGSFLDESGGLGALAHEYGHFLDYYFGTYHNDGSPYRSLTLGRTTAQNILPVIPYKNGDTMQGIACKIVETCINSKYYEKLQKNFSGDYWFRHNEIFARCFEQYIQRKLTAKGISNIFLTQRKYENVAYPDEALAKKLTPMFAKLLSIMRGKIK